MTTSTTSPSLRANLAAALLIALGIAADQLSKLWVIANLPGRPRTLIPGALSFVYAENRNMAFGLGKSIPESVKSWGLILVTSALAIALAVLLVKTVDRKSRFALVLILSGAIGNIIDRVRLGYVVDFIYWHGGFSWPNFNLADSFICVGVGLMLIFLTRQGPESDAAPRPPAATSSSKNAALPAREGDAR